MEKSQFDLCLRVLKKLHQAGVLDGVIIFGRRKSKNKADKDRAQATNLLHFIAKKSPEEIKAIFKTMHKKWQKTVLDSLERLGEKELISILA